MTLYLILSYEVVLGPFSLDEIKQHLTTGRIDNNSAILVPEKINWQPLTRFLKETLDPAEAHDLLYNTHHTFDSLDAFKILNILPPPSGVSDKTTLFDLNKNSSLSSEQTQILPTPQTEAQSPNGSFTLDENKTPFETNPSESAVSATNPNPMEKREPSEKITRLFLAFLSCAFLLLAIGVFVYQQPTLTTSKPRLSGTVIGLQNIYQYMSRIHFSNPNVSGAYLVGLNFIYGYDYNRAAEFYRSPKTQDLIQNSFRQHETAQNYTRVGWHFQWHQTLLLTYADQNYNESIQLIEKMLSSSEFVIDDIGQELLLNLKGINYFFMGENALALAHFEKISKQFPQSGFIKFNYLRSLLNSETSTTTHTASSALPWEEILNTEYLDKDQLQFLHLYLLSNLPTANNYTTYLKALSTQDPFSLLPHQIQAQQALENQNAPEAFEALASGLLIPGEYFNQIRENPFYLAIYPKKILKNCLELINKLKGKLPGVDLELLTFRIESLLQPPSFEELTNLETTLSSPLYEKNPNISFYRMWLAEAWLELEKADKAIAALTLVTDDWRKSEYFLVLMGKTYARLNQKKQARVFFQESIKLASSPVGFYWLGKLLEADGIKLASDQALWMSLERHTSFWLPRKTLAEKLQLLGHLEAN